MTLNLKNLPNIGPNLAKKLDQAGISSSEDLKAIGSENALIRITSLDDRGACINTLYALEGAIQGIRWHDLDKEKKDALREFYRQLDKG